MFYKSKRFIHLFLNLLLFALTVYAPASNAGYCPSSTDMIEVTFLSSYQVRIRNNQLLEINNPNSPVLPEFQQKYPDAQWNRITDVDEYFLDDLYEKTLERGVTTSNLNNIYHVLIADQDNIQSVAKELESKPEILRAFPLPLPHQLPTPSNFQSYQGYLSPSSSTPTGFDFNYAWTLTGGTGTGVTVCDIEYDWNYNHLDITKAPGSQINSNCTTGNPSSYVDHGTAVIGELVADNDGVGTTGVCYGANLLTCCSIIGSTGAWDVPGALATAITNLSPGDVILLEQQWDYSSTAGSADDFIPVEWWGSQDGASQYENSVYSAIAQAVTAGIHVVEAAGNGSYNLDSLTWYGDSGAIIVGAGGTGTSASDLERLYFSSYGSQVDVQGWGENVYTTGYGTLHSELNYNYTSTFSGTSSASPMIAGAIACSVGYWTQGLGHSADALSPSTMRSILSNPSNGSPQTFPGGGNTGHIGPRPNLNAVFSYIASSVPTPTVTPAATNTPVSTPTPYPGEYGDAPDESLNPPNSWDAYPGIPGVQPSHFPTLYYTSQGNDPLGTFFVFTPFTLYLSQSNLVPSTETDAVDPFDPDGLPNINPPSMTADQDQFDDGVIFHFYPQTAVEVYMQGTITQPANFYLLADLNQDGDWNELGELIIDGFPIDPTQVGMPVHIPIPGSFQGIEGEIWVRAVISDVPVWSFVSTMPPLWDGSTTLPLGMGEVEDYLISLPTPPPPPAIPTSSPVGLVLILLTISIGLIFKRR